MSSINYTLQGVKYAKTILSKYISLINSAQRFTILSFYKKKRSRVNKKFFSMYWHIKKVLRLPV